MNGIHVLVVGAGPTGLALALWLTRLGMSVRIVDRSAAPGATSRAFVVHARTLEFYGQLGIAAAAIERGIKITQMNIWTAGRRIAAIPVGDFGAGLSPYPFALALPQNLHERLLIEYLEKAGVTVERETELIDFEQDGSGIRARLRGPTAQDGEQTIDAGFLCGADGARSTVRIKLDVSFPGGTYPQTFYVADVEAHGPTANGSPNFCLDSEDLCAVFPLLNASNVRLIGVLQADPDTDTATIAFEDIAPDVLRKTQLTVERVNWFSTYRVHHRVADRFREGRVFLLGDAAHIHSPAGGQGMNSGIGDAVNLAWKLAAVIRESANPALLDTYENERIGFARRLVRSTDRAFSIATSPGSAARFLRLQVFPALAPRVMRIGFARRLVFRTLSQLNVRYRYSALSAGHAGPLHGGDRLPWLKGEGAGNFDSLQSLRWQVHVYGHAEPAVRKLCSRSHVDLHVFPWRAAAQRAGFRADALYLVRPDGYIAFACRAADSNRLDTFLADRHTSSNEQWSMVDAEGTV